MPIQLLEHNDKIFHEGGDVETIYENSHQSLKFNIMPNRAVEETLLIKKYMVTENRIEVKFDRKYKTQMVSSPDHLIFLSASF